LATVPKNEFHFDAKFSTPEMFSESLRGSISFSFTFLQSKHFPNPRFQNKASRINQRKCCEGFIAQEPNPTR